MSNSNTIDEMRADAVDAARRTEAGKAWRKHKKMYAIHAGEGSITWAAFVHGYDAGHAHALADERRQRQRLEDALRDLGLFLDHVHGELTASGGALFESELQSLLERLDLGRSKVKAALASTQAGGDGNGK